MAFTLDAPGMESAVRNSGGDPTLPPDRFTPIPGNDNYRSAKIASYQQLKMLRDQYGIRTVVNLAKDSMSKQGSGEGFTCSYPNDLCEPKWAAALGMTYIPVYIGSSPPSDSSWAAIQAALKQGNTLVHCTHGVDRTGAVAGRWAKQVLGMTTDQALKYTYQFGGQWRMSGDPNSKLRTWLVAGQYDPSLAGRLSRGVPWLWIGAGVGVLALTGAIVYRIKFK